MSRVIDILNLFHPVQLNELGKAGLMDRTETKFWFKNTKLEDILVANIKAYKILDIQGIRLQHYQSEYFDTNDRHLYLEHHNGRLNRYKIRTRYYTDSQLGFLEIKHKNNKGRTVKSRIEHPYAYGPLTEDKTEFIKDISGIDTSKLKGVLKIEYDRFTLVNKENFERVTVDLNIKFIGDSKTVEIPNLVIAEIKQLSRGESKFIQVMKQYGIRTGSLSKYCMGTVLTNEHIKQNNFREKIRLLNKICY